MISRKRVSYGESSVWDGRFERDGEIDWNGFWIEPFAGTLKERGCQRILDLGCGTGNDVCRLKELGFQATGLDFSQKALTIARSKLVAGLVRADMASGLPFQPQCFDAVFANVALHMFDDTITHVVIQEVRRVLHAPGVFIFHVNSVKDRELRARRKAVAEELTPNFVRETDGQTVHFFSESEIESYFQDWVDLRIEHVFVPHRVTGEPFKAVWRGCATLGG